MSRLITRKQLLEWVPYTDQHLRRLEAKGLFPKRRRIGANRVVWIEIEVIEWFNSCVG